MNRMMFALATVVGMTLVGSARADWGTPPAGPPEGYSNGPTENTAGRYGIHPMFKKLMFWKKDTGCDTCDTGHGCKGGKCKTAPVAPPYGAGYPMPGTLVFPNHQYNRSPRDFFMTGPGN